MSYFTFSVTRGINRARVIADSQGACGVEDLLDFKVLYWYIDAITRIELQDEHIF